jgi:D-glycero-D-manno-heptose 1,7-bisphosphate phosphatase
VKPEYVATASPGGHPIDADGIWRELRTAPLSATKRGALFLDRDGTIIELVHYLHDPAEVQPVKSAGPLVAAANRCGIPVVLVTNQSGIGRGYFGWDDFAAVQARVDRTLADVGGRLDAIYACPHLPGTLQPEPGDDPPCRKPNPGMLLRAADDLGIALGASWIAGDSVSDIEAGKRAGLARGWLMPTGYGSRDVDEARALAAPDFDVVVDRGLDVLTNELDGLAP